MFSDWKSYFLFYFLTHFRGGIHREIIKQRDSKTRWKNLPLPKWNILLNLKVFVCLESSSLCVCRVCFGAPQNIFKIYGTWTVTWKTESAFFKAAAAVCVCVLCGHRRVIKTVNKWPGLVGGERVSVHPTASGKEIKHRAASSGEGIGVNSFPSAALCRLEKDAPTPWSHFNLFESRIVLTGAKPVCCWWAAGLSSPGKLACSLRSLSLEAPSQ